MKHNKIEWENDCGRRSREFHHDRIRQRHLQFRKLIREFLQLLKENEPCTDCGRHFPHYVMDYDHVRGNKKRAISRMSGEHSWNHLIEELDKCDLVCANCHRIREWQRGTGRHVG